MSLLNKLKRILIFPFRRSVQTMKLGSIDTWSIVEPSAQELFVICAGVGHHITFEQDLLKRWDVEMLLLDPSPTGRHTMDQIGPLDGVRYLQVALSAEDGRAAFSQPIHPEEGSYYMVTGANEDETELVEFECVSLKTLLQEAGKDRIDVLKMDIEGAEYDVIDGLLKDGILIDQLCVEIHTDHGSGSQAGLLKVVGLIFRLYRAGYRIVFNTAMDFTFAHRSLLR